MKRIVKSIWVNICLLFSYPKLSKTRRCFIATAFQLCFRITIRKVQEKQVGLKLNGTHQLLVYADVDLFGDNIDTIKKHISVDTGKEVGLGVNAEKN
jgi:hypothetical protein